MDLIKSPYCNRQIEIVVGNDWNILESLESELRDKNVLVLIDKGVRSLHQEAFDAIFKNMPNCQIELFTAVESNKQISSVFKLIDRISKKLPAGRNTVLVAIGGGITLNVGGFIAAIIRRGLDLVVVPTTPMAMSDVAFGSKHGCNSNEVKHYIGTYYDPKRIYLIKSVLHSIDSLKLKRNLIESVKQFLVLDKNLFNLIYQIIMSNNIDIEYLFDEIVYPSALQKIEILRNDPKEIGAGRVLLFGHAVAHPLEVASGFKIPHDEAVAIGMYVELAELVSRNIFSSHDFGKYMEILEILQIRMKNYVYSQELFAKSLFLSKLKGSDDSVALLNLIRLGQLQNDKAFISWKIEDVLKATTERVGNE